MSFSGAGEVYNDKKNKLLPEKSEMLLFVKNNFFLQLMETTSIDSDKHNYVR